MLSVAQGLTAKEIARAFDIAKCTVDKSLQRAMDKLCVPRRAALVAEAARRQIITPLCLLLIGVMALHSVSDAGAARRDRRPTERRGSEMRLVRRADSFDLVV